MKKTRLNLEAIFRSVSDGIISINKDFSIVEVNEGASSICGFSRDSSTGKNIKDLQTGCNGVCIKSIEETIKSKKEVKISHLECHRENRDSQVVTVITSPLFNTQDKFSGAVMVIRDETRLTYLERALDERIKFHNMIGKSPAMQKIYNLIEDLADISSTVLITGESGTGKELIAEALHYKGARKNRPLVKVNCSALSENLLESELFGHVKGAFTGALKDKKGRFEKANGGTIFLDEIGDISPGMQLRLLRVLQEKEFERVGDSTPIKVDIRILAATNQNLTGKIKSGLFREDLYYRLKVVEIKLPPLNKRTEDIPLLTEHFLKKFNKEFKKEIISVSREVQKIFMNHSWPGNLRQLEHTIEHACILCRGPVIDTGDLPQEFQHMPRKFKTPPVKERKGNEKELIEEALRKAEWNKAKASRNLGFSRLTLYKKIKKYNINRDD